MKNTKKLIVSLVAMFLAVCTISGTLAFLITSVGPIANIFTPGDVDGEIIETFDNNEKKNIKVKNTGNVDAYFRVKLISYWYAKDDNSIVAKDSWFDEAAWKEKADNGWFYDNGYFYYPAKVSPDHETNVLFDEVIKLEDDSAGNRQVLEILAEAIQSVPKTAVESAWNVIVNADGTISKK